MLVHPQFDPIALAIGPFSIGSFIIGPFAIRWYGLMYLIAFGLFYVLGRYRINRGVITVFTRQSLEDLLSLGMLGIILGGRLGYVFFYKPAYYLAHPLEIIMIWQGGMSFHGGLLGVIVAGWYFAWRRQQPFLAIMDAIAPLVPLGLAAGRLGNFINAELWGRPTDLPWGMVFPSVDYLPRHPSQLYQAAGEGLLLFLVLWWFSRRPRPIGHVSGVFLIGYGFFRFLAEFAREPDYFLGLLALNLTMGQWLCLPMFTIGCLLMLRRTPIAEGLPRSSARIN